MMRNLNFKLKPTRLVACQDEKQHGANLEWTLPLPVTQPEAD